MIRNAVEHSLGSSVYVCGQFFPSNNTVEVAIADQGIGVYESLMKNKELKIESSEKALSSSIMPGISGKFLETNPDDESVNSGFGLYVTSKLCNKHGQFLITSCDKSLLLKDGTTRYFDSDYKGTSVSLVFSTNSGVNYKEELDAIIEKGEEEVRARIKNPIFQASKLSKKISQTSS
ncbi:ATP-binding protein [Solidesulfovibrio sp. C21]|uniref:ATP-binding protein n=1 Tax=Solidesulfovibrio sp. C21 TaxID=3398613 RepID=UPI0039FDCF56